MKLSSRAEYGVRAMIALAINYHHGPVALKNIAFQEGISFNYLEQIFPSLRRTGLVESTRGTQGGYRLARPPEEVRIGDIIRAVDGPITLARCIGDQDKSHITCCERTDQCVTRSVWERLRDHINDFLDGISLADMIRWGEPSVIPLETTEKMLEQHQGGNIR